MIVYKTLEEIKNIQPTSVALGNFDGIHIGHQALVKETVRIAKEKGIKSSVFTFSNHPKNVISGENMIKNIIYFDEKTKALEELGVDYLFSVDYTKELGCMSPKAFAKDLLAGTFQMQYGICGFNYRFGHRAAGTPKLLIEEGKKLGFNLSVLDPIMVDGNIVSSTLIRGLISQGEMEECLKYLGRYYAMGGTVVEGNHIGRTIGFPTVNVTVDESMVMPPNGVYISYCKVGEHIYEAITNVGSKPTIGLYQKNVETHLFHFNENLYGKEVRVELVKKLRDEKKFGNVEELAKEIHKNCISAKEYHRKHVRVE